MKKINFLFLALCLTTTISYSQKIFNRWSFGLYGGSSYLHSSQLTSLGGNERKLFNLSGQIEATYNVTHAIGIMAYYDRGGIEGFANESEEMSSGPSNEPQRVEVAYSAFGLGMDVNLSLIGRRANRPRVLKWAWHAYSGLGFINYDSEVYNFGNMTDTPSSPPVTEGGNFLESGYLWFGTGLRYRLNRRIDFEFRAKYNFTLDTQFDGVADDPAGESDGDNYFQALLGIRIKVGKRSSSYSWTDPITPTKIKLKDSDGDGVMDDFDKEPNTPRGVYVYGNGVSIDSDGDKIPNHKDRCPYEAGVERLQGCPEKTDKDGDGVYDDMDDCPNTPGPATNAGCPEVEAADLQQLALLAKSIFFASGKSRILQSSYSSLNEIGEIIKKYPEYKFYIDGYTDSVGSSQSNKILSEKRSKSVIDYLIRKGVANDGLISRGFGEENPIADNSTASGRQLNRRAEIKLARDLL